MTRPMSEPNHWMELSSHAHRLRQLERRPFSTGATYHIKLCSDTSIVTATYPPLFYWTVPADIVGMRLFAAMAAVSAEPDNGDLEVYLVQYVKAEAYADYAMLSDYLTIDDGDLDSFDSAVQPTVVTTVAPLALGDKIVVEVVSPSEDAKGLEVALTFV